jgi:hypothetical protein
MQLYRTHVAFTDDTNVSDNLDSSRSEHVVLVVREGLGWSDDDRVTSMRAQWVEVLHVAADDSVLSIRD